MAEESTGDSKQGQLSPRSPSGAGVAGGVVNKPTSPRSPAAKPTRRVRLTDQQLEAASKEELAGKWREQESYIEILEAQASAQDAELTSLKESEEKFRQQFTEASYREKILVRRLASKEQELQDYVSQITELKAAQTPSVSSLRSALLDPAVNILIQKLRQELLTTKAKLEDTQNELSAWKFTPDSNTGKRLMAKCRLLYQENEDLGRMISSGRIAKLEGMQSTIYFLQQELRKARESVTLLQQENLALKSLPNENNLSNGLSPHTPPIIKKEEEQDELENEVIMSKSLAIEPEEYKVDEDGACTPPLKNQVAIPANQENDESSSDSAALIIKVENEELTDRENEEDENKSGRTLRRTKGAKCCSSGSSSAGDKTNGDDSTSSRTTNALRLRDRGDCRTVDSRGDRERTKRDKSAHSSDEEQHHQIRDCGRLKKKRRESILSIDYNDADDDAIVLTNGETLQSDPE
ncbi:Similar to wtap: Pre-mRNA-splicing regulator WTAP (Danio rerio) [Cotesia congregata]|uniref:Similar to wtap: Pre-mRNA-splicing regulator WTAP (Danio rerio) n=1 Tax=Cotesia congregata TaxID=51543 RepID=A0A8J2HDB5_COTCN|nr:Similar to wtap: Pre-mRNA-splicing regulator WTAP (Danio rerio) [Cotesia congregata]